MMLSWEFPRFKLRRAVNCACSDNCDNLIPGCLPHIPSLQNICRAKLMVSFLGSEITNQGSLSSPILDKMYFLSKILVKFGKSFALTLFASFVWNCWQFDTSPTQGWGKVGARSGQGWGKLAAIPMYSTLITPPSLSPASITNQSLYHYLLMLFVQTLPEPCPDLACPDLARTLLFIRTLPQPCPNLAPTLPKTLPQPCPNLA